MTTKIFGHRGIPTRFPENSLAGFAYAIENGVEGLEFDVQLTQDLVPVVMHDERIDRTTDGHGLIFNATYAELSQVHLTNGEQIPSLADFLALVANEDVQLNLEFKTDLIHYPEIERRVLAMIAKTPLVHPVIFSSFDLATLQRAYAIDSTQNYCYLADHMIAHPLEFIRQEHLQGLHLNRFDPLAPVTERIWTVNEDERLKTLVAQDVAGIFTDDFEHAMAIRDAQLQVLS